MKSIEELISPDSDYYIYSPSQTARTLFFYPLYVGNFIYEPGYQLCRDSYDSFLIMYIRKGTMLLTLDGEEKPIEAGCFALVDCFHPHAYRSLHGCECLWLHFDGPVAREWYRHLVLVQDHVFSLPDSSDALAALEEIFHIFHAGMSVREAAVSQLISGLLTALLPESSTGNGAEASGLSGQAITYINEHFSDPITVDSLAARCSVSTYHFIRQFKRETGLTPHRYLLNTRLNAAKYLLKNSRLSVKDICFRTGFSCESVFCSAFKREQGLTAQEYRHTVPGK